MNVAASLLVAPIGRTGRSTTAAGSDQNLQTVGDQGGLLSEIRAAADGGADLIVLPQLSFSPYFPANRNREALELGERFPSKPMAAAREAARDSWLAASGYECKGEGVFYVRGELGSGSAGCHLVQQQHRIEAATGRYEQMFFSPGHTGRAVAESPWGAVGMLIGADVREIGSWTELLNLGASLVLASVSETADSWRGTCSIAAGLATVYGIALVLVNRSPADDEPDFAGGSLVVDPDGQEIAAGADGLFPLESFVTSARREV